MDTDLYVSEFNQQIVFKRDFMKMVLSNLLEAELIEYLAAANIYMGVATENPTAL